MDTAGSRTLVAFPAGGASLSGTGIFADRIMAKLAEMQKTSHTQHAQVAAIVLPAETVRLLHVDLPVTGRRARIAALPFAVEDRISIPIERAHVALCQSTGTGAVLAAVVDRDAMARLGAPVVPVLPETLAIPAPLPDASGRPVWAVWRDGSKAVIRQSDGSGFGLRADMLEMAWSRAGQPAVISYGAALPKALGAQDRSAAPPPPEARDLAVDLRQGDFAPQGAGWARPLRAVAAMAVLGALAHLGLAVADLAALRDIARDVTQQTQAELSRRVPGVSLSAGAQAIGARLAPPTATGQGSGFLPLLARAADPLLIDAPPVTLRRLTWSAADGLLRMQVEASGLQDLQQIERLLGDAGLEVTSGVATASDGAARAELTLSGGQP